MDTLPQTKNLNEYQLEILKLFTRELEENDFIEIKRLIVKYLAKRITEIADGKWQENNWSNDDMERLLKTRKRTSYNPDNQLS